MNKSVKTKKLITRRKPVANSRNHSRRKKIKVVEEVEEEVKDEAVDESDDEVGSLISKSVNEVGNIVSKTRSQEANPGNRSRRKKIKLVEEVEEEVKDEAVDESGDEVGSPIGDTVNEVGSPVSETANEAGSPISETANEVGSDVSESANEDENPSDEEIKRDTDDEDEIMSDSDKEVVKTKVIKRKRKRKMRKYNPKEEARLERLVFGDPKDVINNLLKVEESKIREDADRIRKLHEVSDDSDNEMPEVLADSDNNMPEVQNGSDDDLPKVHDGSDDDLPEVQDNSDEDLPEVQDNSDDDLPEVQDNSDDNLPAVLDDSDDSNDSDIRINCGAESDETNDTKVHGKAAWVDDDDIKYSINDALEVQNRKLPKGRTEKSYTELLEKKFTELVGTPKWASLDAKLEDGDEDSDNEILKHSTHLQAPKGKKLRKGIIDIKALTDINKSTHNEGPVVSSLQFHPTSTVAFVAGQSGILSLFQIDGKENNKLHSICFEKFHINCAKFLKEGSEVIMGSRSKSYSQAYDLMSGKTYKIPLPHGITNMQKFEVSPDGKWIAIVGRKGEIHLLSGATKELVATFKMNKRCLALAFSPDSGKLISHGDTEEMYIWDLKSRSCLHKAIDDGCIAGSAIAFSPSGQFVATGSKQGVVNIYDSESVLTTRTPQPLKIIMNLVTSITNLKFNPTSEILAMSSSLQVNAFKMVHIPSFTVFANFPTYQTKINNPLDIDFSPSSGYLGLSNNKSYAFLYRLKHYGNY